YWQAIDAPVGERTVSVRLLAQDGFLLSQQDNQPSNGARPTSWWEPGWYFRDVYYLEIPEGTAPMRGSVELLLYDSFSGELVPFDSGEEQLTLSHVTIAE
ncbi:MAG: hypothetical protein AAF633_23700, partial [Chloroflexota bacterium]